jgi:hypothetical protein
MRRLAFLLGKLLKRSNVIGAYAFNEVEEKLALLPIIELIEVFHFTRGRSPWRRGASARPGPSLSLSASKSKH